MNKPLDKISKPHKKMEIAVFQINDRFLVDRNKNEIWDKEKKQKTKLEPRLMKLLCLLSEQRGELITREYLIKEIWNEYPGANEGLNQAISFLRKQLEDDDKLIIKTVPKAGYTFYANVGPIPENMAVKKKESRWTRMIGIGLSFGILLLLIIYYTLKRNTHLPNEDFSIKSHVELSRLDSIHQAKTLEKNKQKQAEIADDKNK